MPISAPKDKKYALQARKEKLLQELMYYDKRLEEFRASISSKIYYEDGYSSDSDDGFPTPLNTGPSNQQLKLQKSMLQTCLQATQELTSLQVVESEVNVMVDTPVIEGELLVLEPGIWQEVTAECRIDLVPFSIMFCVHKPHRKFGPPSYRCLKVLPVKNAHEAELSKSVLPGVTRPSDAIDVIRSYAEAYRSRRSTLARLADKYAHNLFMEPMAEGGYLLKCADLLEVSWRLENKWSPVAAFHHKMKFDLEYMDESYIKIITQAHKQLSDPSIETDERTLLLAKIINTCLEAQEPTQKLYESMESDPETKKLEKRRTTLDEEVEAPAHKKKKENTREEKKEARDDQIMAPPKSLPKKVKPKGKENMNENRKAVKRASEDGNTKKAKVARNGNTRQSVSDLVEALSKNDKNDKNKTDNDNNDANIENKKANANNKTSTALTKKDKTKAGTNLKIVDKESNGAVNAINGKKKSKTKGDDDDGKIITDEIKTKNQDKVMTNIPNDKDGNIKIQDNNKKKTGKGQVEMPQKVINKEKNAAITKNVPKTIEPAPERPNEEEKDTVQNRKISKADKILNDKQQKLVAKDKTDPLTKEAKVPTVKPGKDKNALKSKNDQKSENNFKKGSVNVPHGETRKLTEENKVTHDDEPKTKNVDKKLTKVAKNNEKVKNSKLSKIINDDGNGKAAEKNIDNLTKDGKNNEKVKNSKASKMVDDDGNEKAAENKIDNPEKIIKSQSHAKSVKSNTKTTTNEDTGNKKIDKLKEANKDKISKPNKDKHLSENIVNNKREQQKPTNTQKELVNSEQNTENVDSQKNIQKAKITKPKNIDTVTKNVIDKPKSDFNPKTSNPVKKSTEKYSKQIEKGGIVEKSVKVKNVASRNKEYISDLDTGKNKIEEIPKPKMVIKNLSHKNPSAQNRLSKKITDERTTNMKKIKTGNNVKNLKSGNTGKDNGGAKISKIPQKKMSTFSDGALPRNPLRISPRKIPSNFKSVSDSNLKYKQKITNIPRLVKKTETK